MLTIKIIPLEENENDKAIHYSMIMVMLILSNENTKE